MCGRPEDAEEVAQETLLKVFENFDQLREPERVRAWVFRIAKNACLMQRRKSVFAPAHELSLDELPPASKCPTPPGRPIRELLRSELRAVRGPRHRRAAAVLPGVVLLRDLEELSTEETAQILDFSTDVVKTRLHRGRLAMRQKLDCYVHNHCLEDQPSSQSFAAEPPGARSTVLRVAQRYQPGPDSEPRCDSGHSLRRVRSLTWSQRLLEMATLAAPPVARPRKKLVKRAGPGPLPGAAARLPVGLSGAQRLDRRRVLPVRALLRDRRTIACAGRPPGVEGLAADRLPDEPQGAAGRPGSCPACTPPGCFC